MNIEIISQDKSSRVPRQFIAHWLKQVETQLQRRQVLPQHETKTLVLVFVNRQQMKKINFQYRGKNYPTDVLSFSSEDPTSYGELLMSLEVLKKQAQEHDLTWRFELGYMLIHGLLHLLGFEHEKSKHAAQKMFHLQDEVFDELLRQFKN